MFSRLWPCFLGAAGVAGCTWASFQLGQNLGSTGFLYLTFVVLAAVHGGFWQATAVSLMAVGCLDYFFIEPVLSFRIARLSDMVAMGAFEFTALTISQLSNRAHLRELEAAQLYQTARRILLLNSPAPQGGQVARLIRESFQLRGVVLFDAAAGTVHRSGDSGTVSDALTRDAYSLDHDEFNAREQTWVCTLRIGEQPMGAISLCGTRMSQPAASALASLAAIALERARVLDRECSAEAARQAEQLRSAVLDALAHKVKTPLTVIRTAISGLPDSGELSEAQRELVSLIDQETEKLSNLATRLLGARELCPEEFVAQPEPLLLSRLIGAAIQELERPADRNRFQFEIPQNEPVVFADRDLILTALAQLLDNALKYSAGGTPVEIDIVARDNEVVLRMRSQGLVVQTHERERIFERFYRTPAARHQPGGTGLGLSIVKTIAMDHQGRVWAEGEPDYGTTFFFSLPVVAAGGDV